jgi:hypothetical protein
MFLCAYTRTSNSILCIKSTRYTMVCPVQQLCLRALYVCSCLGWLSHTRTVVMPVCVTPFLCTSTLTRNLTNVDPELLGCTGTLTRNLTNFDPELLGCTYSWTRGHLVLCMRDIRVTWRKRLSVFVAVCVSPFLCTSHLTIIMALSIMVSG